MLRKSNLSVQPPVSAVSREPQKLKIYTERQLGQIPQLERLPESRRFEMRVVAQVLPFRVNQYVLDELIDWTRVPDDPVFQLTFPQKGMLSDEHYERVARLLRTGADKQELAREVADIRKALNPHPAGQQLLNVPRLNDALLPGMQHKYRETVLFFPSQGQTCHSYCSFCFRWPQFLGDKDLRFSTNEAHRLHQYLERHHQISDLLITGGDPMVMKTKHLSDYLLPLLHDELSHIQNIRIGTKSLTFWPQRYVTDPDADELLRLLKRMVDNGKHVALMAHFNHPQELSTDICREAILRLRDAGVVLRAQAPLLRNINDDPAVWSELWRTQVELGIVPYYMFVERDTGAKPYFELPLARAYEIYRDAMRQVSGLARTARGPSMSAGPGKVEILGVEEIAGEKVFMLRFLQGRNPDWTYKPFFAKFDPEATWLDQLKPAFGAEDFFFEPEYRAMQAAMH